MLISSFCEAELIVERIFLRKSILVKLIESPLFIGKQIFRLGQFRLFCWSWRLLVLARGGSYGRFVVSTFHINVKLNLKIGLLCSLLLGLGLFLFFDLLSFFVLKVTQVASFTHASCVQFPISMLTLAGLLLPAFAVVAITAKTLSIVRHVSMFALRN